MLRWLGRIRKWKQERAEAPLVCHYGQYVYKPVVARAISMVMDVSQAEACAWVANPEIDIYLNGELLQGAQWAQKRMESGDYEIKIPSQNKVWRFFIA